MKVAIDKNSMGVAKKDNNEYIYLFDNEPLEELLKIIGRILLTIAINTYAIYWGNLMYKYYIKHSYISKFFIIITLITVVLVLYGNYAIWSNNIKIRHFFYKTSIFFTIAVLTT